MARPSTPPRSHAPFANDTPSVAKHSLTAKSIHGNLSEGRQAVIEDLGHSVPQVPVQFFIQHILPPLRRGLHGHRIDNIIRALKGGPRPAISQKGRWRGFPSDPITSGFTEENTFRPLVQVVEAICTAATRYLGATQRLLDFVHNPNSAPHSQQRDNLSRPDGYFILRRRSAETQWKDIAASAEYKKGYSLDDPCDNMKKILWSMNHTLREDPRRRFALGFTIENTNMRLWFSSRAETLATEPFNFITDHKFVVHFFLSMMYADEVQVGWDPTIATHEVGGKIQYDYTVRSARDGTEMVYRTKEMLSDIGADALRGRGTRVWKVVKLEGGEENEGGKYPGGTAKSVPASDVTERLEECLLTVECHGDVYIGGVLDHTRDLMTHGEKVETSTEISTQRQEMKSGGSKVAKGSHIAAEDYHAQQKAKRIKYHPKVHYRIVFKEVCDQLHSITSLSAVFHVLSWAAIGLSAIHQCGWVHRDISIGNILVLNSRAKISDLEYAKKVEHDRTHDIRTGTAAFMSVETASQCYKFMPMETKSKINREFDFRVVSDASRRARTSRPLTTGHRTQALSKRPPYKYNPLHDLESIWWVAVYLVVNKEVINQDEDGSQREVAERAEHQREWANSLFDSLIGRVDLLRTPEQFTLQVPMLHPSVRWIGFDILDNARSLLVAQYTEVEKDLTSITETVADGLHIPFFKLFNEAALLLENDNIEIGPLRNPPAISNARRGSIDEPHRRRVAILDASTRSGIKRKAENLEPEEDSHDEGINERSTAMHRVSTRSVKRAKSSHLDVLGGDDAGTGGSSSRTGSGIERNSVDRREKDRQPKNEVHGTETDASSLWSAGKRKRKDVEDNLDGEENDERLTAALRTSTRSGKKLKSSHRAGANQPKDDVRQPEVAGSPSSMQRVVKRKRRDVGEDHNDEEHSECSKAVLRVSTRSSKKVKSSHRASIVADGAGASQFKDDVQQLEVAGSPPSTRRKVKQTRRDVGKGHDDEEHDERSTAMGMVSTRSSKKTKSSHRDVPGEDPATDPSGPKEPSTPVIEGELDLVAKSKAAHLAISAPFSEPLDFSETPLVMQYEVEYQKGGNCGGGYLGTRSCASRTASCAPMARPTRRPGRTMKLLEDGYQTSGKEFSDETTWVVMFGPDLTCPGTKNYFIFRHKNPITGEYEEKHLILPPKPSIEKTTNLYTLVLHQYIMRAHAEHVAALKIEAANRVSMLMREGMLTTIMHTRGGRAVCPTIEKTRGEMRLQSDVVVLRGRSENRLPLTGDGHPLFLTSEPNPSAAHLERGTSDASPTSPSIHTLASQFGARIVDVSEG
ncbi:hypothetical protein EW146_g9612 [Bondarzewia mesenterica]|uniref:Fungal-type protein kinase domain-containing protein n=1 Tax=Bondarzewia mesenterica TaxID=1095465 RepID=A0A4S4L4R6_9AGAM|nr:hypothetical protein EW146_g9612 [Bondarzewia mesenterica]